MAQDAGTSAGYCCKCFYDLRGIGTASKCPECGQPFDLTDPMTFRKRRPRGIWRRARWVVYPLLLIVLAASAGVGWLWWGWHREQAGIEWVKQHRQSAAPMRIWAQRIGPTWLRNGLGRWRYLLERVDSTGQIVVGAGETAEQSPLWRLQGMTEVSLCGEGVTDHWVALLGNHLRQARTITLWGTAVTDSGVAPLRHLRNLKELSLVASPIGDEALGHLGDLPELTDLSLERIEIHGPGLAHLSGLPKLESVWLSGSPVDDSAIDALAKLGGLKRLSVRHTKITPAGLATLQKALPNCQIDPP